MQDVRGWRKRVEAWVDKQATCPSRKTAAKQFPEVPVKVIRAVLQSREDRERQASQ